MPPEWMEGALMDEWANQSLPRTKERPAMIEAALIGEWAMPTDSEPAEKWGVVELMGHVKLAGRLTEEEFAGGKLGRVDVPQGDGSFATQFFGHQAVYRITYVTEEVARHVARQTRYAPVSAWDFPRPQLPAPIQGTSDAAVCVGDYESQEDEGYGCDRD